MFENINNELPKIYYKSLKRYNALIVYKAELFRDIGGYMSSIGVYYYMSSLYVFYYYLLLYDVAGELIWKFLGNSITVDLKQTEDVQLSDFCCL